MPPRDHQETYRRFARIWANSQVVRSELELAAAMEAAGVGPAQVTEEWLRGLDPEWVYGRADAPFADEWANRAYRRLVAAQ